MKSLGVFGSLVVAVCVASAGAATINVGPTRTYQRIQDAINVCSNGDTILVDPGTYVGTMGVMVWDGPSNVTLKGNGGRPVIDLGPDHTLSVWGKGTCTITTNSSNITIDSIEFKNAFGRDTAPYNDNSHNGAGIRWDGSGMLRVANCVIHDCEDGILGTTTLGGDFLMENTVMYNNGSLVATNGTHNVYLGGGGEGGINTATAQYNWVYNAKAVHDLKMTARVTKILYNRVGDEVVLPIPGNGTAAAPQTGGGHGNEIDMPKGGLGYVIGNIIIKGFSADDGNVLRYGEEGIFASYSAQLYSVYNTYFGQRSTGSNHFNVIAASASPMVLANNFFVAYNGDADIMYEGSVNQNATLLNSNIKVYEHQGQGAAQIGMVNYHPSVTAPWIDAHLVTGSQAIGAATLPGGGALAANGGDNYHPELGTFSLTPVKQYVQAVQIDSPSSENRSACTSAGAFELNNNNTVHEVPIVFAGSSAKPMNAPAGFTQRAVTTVNGTLMGAVQDDGLSGGATVTWSKSSGPGTVTFSSPNSPITFANFSVAGVYTLQLTAVNGQGSASSTCTVQAEVGPALGISTGTQTVPYNSGTGTASLVGTAVDSDGGPAALAPAWAAQYRANVDLGYNCTATNTTGLQYTLTMTPGGASLSQSVAIAFTMPVTATQETFPCRLQASDGAVFVYQPVVITVGGGPINNAPIVDTTTGPAFMYEGWAAPLTNISCTGTDPDAGDSVASYAWTQTGGKSVGTIAGATTATASFTVPALTLTTDGALTFQVTATDTHAGTSAPKALAVNAYMQGDITHDGYVNVGDLQALVSSWGMHASGLAADLNADTYVNVGDLQALVSNWGRSLH